mmetsp:Transcript_44911/g.132671  ORF Transcript_44911/g.132671 Transcript_44911/m.132671 type:complete len:335 (-) Transcript_44911:1418-2422(-)
MPTPGGPTPPSTPLTGYSLRAPRQMCAPKHPASARGPRLRRSHQTSANLPYHTANTHSSPMRALFCGRPRLSGAPRVSSLSQPQSPIVPAHARAASLVSLTPLGRGKPRASTKHLELHRCPLSTRTPLPESRRKSHRSPKAGRRAAPRDRQRAPHTRAPPWAPAQRARRAAAAHTAAAPQSAAASFLNSSKVMMPSSSTSNPRKSFMRLEWRSMPMRSSSPNISRLEMVPEESLSASRKASMSFSSSLLPLRLIVGWLCACRMPRLGFGWSSLASCARTVRIDLSEIWPSPFSSIRSSSVLSCSFWMLARMCGGTSSRTTVCALAACSRMFCMA